MRITERGAVGPAARRAGPARVQLLHNCCTRRVAEAGRVRSARIPERFLSRRADSNCRPAVYEWHADDAPTCMVLHLRPNTAPRCKQRHRSEPALLSELLSTRAGPVGQAKDKLWP